MDSDESITLFVCFRCLPLFVCFCLFVHLDLQVGDKLYEVTMLPQKAGHFDLIIGMDGKQVRGSLPLQSLPHHRSNRVHIQGRHDKSSFSR